MILPLYLIPITTTTLTVTPTPAPTPQSWLANRRGLDVRRCDCAFLHKLFSLLLTPGKNGDVCKADKTRPGTSSPPGPAGSIAAAAQHPAAAWKLKKTSVKATHTSGRKSSWRESLMQPPPLPARCRCRSGSSQESDFKWVAATRPRLQESHVWLRDTL